MVNAALKQRVCGDDTREVIQAKAQTDALFKLHF